MALAREWYPPTDFPSRTVLVTAIAHRYISSLGVREVTLFTVSAILLLDTLATSASIGVSSITRRVLLGRNAFRCAEHERARRSRE